MCVFIFSFLFFKSSENSITRKYLCQNIISFPKFTDELLQMTVTDANQNVLEQVQVFYRMSLIPSPRNRIYNHQKHSFYQNSHTLRHHIIKDRFQVKHFSTKTLGALYYQCLNIFVPLRNFSEDLFQNEIQVLTCWSCPLPAV